MLNSQNTHLIETSYDRLKSREIISTGLENLAKAGVFRWVTNIHEHKRYYYTLIIIHYFKEHSEHYTNLSTLNHNVRFLPCQHRGVGIMQYVYALNPIVHRFNYSRTLPPEKFPVRAVAIVNPGIQWRFIAPDNTLININNMKFHSLFRVCLIFYTYDSANFKKHQE